MNIGSHLSISKGYTNIGKTALKMNANTFQFFTRNPRGAKAKEIDFNDVEGLKNIMEKHNFAPILAHAPYTLNLCSKNEKTREFAKKIFKDDLKRLEHLPCHLYNFHPGSHTGQGLQKGIEQIVETLNNVITQDEKTIVLLETMAGQGTEIGKTFEELKAIIDRVNYQENLGVCLDTCHIFSAGYDIVNDLDGVLEHFDKTIGLNKLKAIHLNDSMAPFKSGKDRHAGIGKGEIGLDALLRVITHPKLKKLPFFLETPYEVEGHTMEIRMLKSAIHTKI